MPTLGSLIVDVVTPILPGFATFMIMLLVILGACLLRSRAEHFECRRAIAVSFGMISGYILGLAAIAGYMAHNLGWVWKVDFGTGFDFLSVRWHFVLMSAFPPIGLTIGLLICRNRLKIDWREWGLRLPSTSPLHTLVLVLLLIAVAETAIAISEWWAKGSTVDTLYIDTITGAAGLHAAIYMFYFLFAGPLLEEFVFRGALFAALRAVVPVSGALLIQAAAFGMVHGSMQHAAPIFLLGLILGFGYHRTGSLVAPVLIHCMMNLFAITGHPVFWLTALVAT